MKAGICVSFDDHHVPSWHKALELFASYGAKATFFVSRFQELEAEEIGMLHALHDAGHAIGCHGMNRLRAACCHDACGVERFLDVEIRPAIGEMKKRGLKPKCYSYPFSARCPQTDTALWRNFKRLRSGVWPLADERVQNSAMTPAMAWDRCRLAYGLNINHLEPYQVSTVITLINVASNQGKVLHLVANDISNEFGQHMLSEDNLGEIFSAAKKAGLEFLTYAD